MTGRAVRLLTTGVTVLAVAGGATVAFGTPAHADPGPFVVTTDTDSGPGSLRAALATAEAVSSDDTITFDPTVTGTIALTSGELDTAVGGSSGNLVIEGPGSGHLSVDAGGLSRVLSVTGPGGDVRPTVAVSGLTLTHGATPLNNPEDGGAVRTTGVDLALDDVAVCGSRGGNHGGGVAVTGGSLTVLSSSVTGNKSTETADFSGGGGGGLDLDAGSASGVALTVTDSTISGNTTSERGGGIRSVGAPVTITRSTVSGNTAYYVWHGVEAATVLGVGGGISAPDLTLVDSSVTGNEAGSGGGGVAGRSVVVTGSTIADNVAGSGGGGLSLDGTGPGAQLDVTSSTVSGNRASSGGGVYTKGVVPVHLKQSTVTANAAVTGGGIDTTTHLTAEGSIVAMNAGGDLAGDAIATLTRSLVQELRGVTDDGTGGPVIDADPLLAALADNGGPTETSLPAPNSPVVDQGAAFGATTDQRGSARPTDDLAVADAIDGSDVGAVELQSAEQTGPPQVASAARPTITGTVRVGQTLHTDGGAWLPTDAIRTYQWLRDGLPIPGATQASYTLTSADWGQNFYGEDFRKRISVRVTATAADHRDGTALSDFTPFVGLGDLRVSRPASLTGRLRVGSTLHARARLRAISPRPAAAYYSWRVHGRWLRAHSSSLELKPWMRGKRVHVAIAYAAVPGYHRLVQEARGAHPVRAR